METAKSGHCWRRRCRFHVCLRTGPSGLADEIVLRDANHELAMGQVLDLAHGQAFFPSVQIREGQAADYADARLIVITPGPNSAPANRVWRCCNATSKSSGTLLTKSCSSARPPSFWS